MKIGDKVKIRLDGKVKQGIITGTVPLLWGGV